MEFFAALHNKAVHFPIAFLSLYVLLEIIGVVFKKDFFSKSAHLLLLLGVIGGVAAVLTGNQAEQMAEQLHERGAVIPFDAIEKHIEYANITLWYFTGLLLFRTYLSVKKKFLGYIKYLVIILAVVGGYFIYQAGFHGGELVYRYGVGTELIKSDIEE